MDLSKLSLWQKIILGAGILIFINIFLPWYRISLYGYSANANAFDAGFLAWFGSFCAFAAAVLIAIKVFTKTKIEAGPLKAEHLALLLSALGTFFILLRLVTETNFLFIGVFIGLVAAAGMTYASFMAMKEEGMGLSDFKDLSGGPGPGGDAPPPPPPPSV